MHQWGRGNVFFHSTYEIPGIRQAVTAGMPCGPALRTLNTPAGRSHQWSLLPPFPQKRTKTSRKERQTGKRLANSMASGCIQHLSKASRKQGTGHKHSSHLFWRPSPSITVTLCYESRGHTCEGATNKTKSQQPSTRGHRKGPGSLHVVLFPKPWNRAAAISHRRLQGLQLLLVLEAHPDATHNRRAAEKQEAHKKKRKKKKALLLPIQSVQEDTC